jgi:hypothetical protein
MRLLPVIIIINWSLYHIKNTHTSVYSTKNFSIMNNSLYLTNYCISKTESIFLIVLLCQAQYI